MAFYKEQCINCGSLIERDSKLCPNCATNSPFNYKCPTCLKVIEKTQKICSGCGRNLYIECPKCKQETFVQEKCEKCRSKPNESL